MTSTNHFQCAPPDPNTSQDLMVDIKHITENSPILIIFWTNLKRNAPKVQPSVSSWFMKNSSRPTMLKACLSQCWKIWWKKINKWTFKSDVIVNYLQTFIYSFSLYIRFPPITHYGRLKECMPSWRSTNITARVSCNI